MERNQNRRGLGIGIHPRRISQIGLGKRSITADTALRFARYFGTAPQFWLGLQADYELDVAMDAPGERLEAFPQIRSWYSLATLWPPCRLSGGALGSGLTPL